MKEFRFIGDHAETLDNGRPVGPGEYTGSINEKASKNAQLIRDGVLIEVPMGAAEMIANADSTDDMSVAVKGAPIEDERDDNSAPAGDDGPEQPLFPDLVSVPTGNNDEEDEA